MQMYLADCIFPDIESQLAAYKSFCELWDSGEMSKADRFEGFEMLFRVHAPWGREGDAAVQGSQRCLDL